MMLKLDGVSKSYNGVCALRPTDLVIPAGRRIVLIGPSGSGKSTLLRLIVGLISPNTGSIELDNQQLCAANITQARLRMGYVIQDGGLFPHLTARDNVVLMSTYLGWPRERIDRRLEEL